VLQHIGKISSVERVTVVHGIAPTVISRQIRDLYDPD
jgi:hypothetical protein